MVEAGSGERADAEADEESDNPVVTLLGEVFHDADSHHGTEVDQRDKGQTDTPDDDGRGTGMHERGQVRWGKLFLEIAGI